MTRLHEPYGERVILEQQKIGAQHRVGPHVRNSLQFSQVVEKETGALLLALEAYVLTKKVQDTEQTLILSIPDGWFQIC